MIYSDTDRREIYCAPFLGNGEITLQIMPDGAMDPGMRGELIKAYPSCCIWWAGRRTRGGSNRALLSFGRFEQKLIAKEELTAVHYTQELDVADAQVKCHTVYGDGNVVDTQVFVRTDCNLIAVKKSIFPRSSLCFSLSCSLCGKGSSECLPDFTLADVAAGKNGGAIHYKLTDQEDLSGMVRFVCDTESRVSVSDNAVTLSREIASPAELCYYIALSDSMDRDDYTEFTLSMITSALADGFGRQKAAHGKI